MKYQFNFFRVCLWVLQHFAWTFRGMNEERDRAARRGRPGATAGGKECWREAGRTAIGGDDNTEKHKTMGKDTNLFTVD